MKLFFKVSISRLILASSVALSINSDALNITGVCIEHVSLSARCPRSTEGLKIRCCSGAAEAPEVGAYGDDSAGAVANNLSNLR